MEKPFANARDFATYHAELGRKIRQLLKAEHSDEDVGKAVDALIEQHAKEHREQSSGSSA